MEFSASKSFWIKAITFVLAVGFVMLAVGAFLSEGVVSAMIFPAAILVLVIGLSYFFSVRKYEITHDSIIVHRPFDMIKIPKATIATAQRVEKKDIRMSIRTFGIGGVFAYTGQFWNGKFGSMTWYVTRMDSAVLLIDSKKRKTVISPDNPEEFISVLQS
jgi:hypothetical protein